MCPPSYVASVPPAVQPTLSPIFPSDILLILLHLADRPTLFILLRVNHFFHHAARPLLFHNLQLVDRKTDLTHFMPSRTSATKNGTLDQVRFLTLGAEADFYPYRRTEDRLADPGASTGKGYSWECLYSRCPYRWIEMSVGVIMTSTEKRWPGPETEAEWLKHCSARSCDCGNNRFHSDPTTPLLPNLQALRFSCEGSFNSCQKDPACAACDFYQRLTPRTWVIDMRDHSPLYPSRYSTPYTLETIVIVVYFQTDMDHESEFGCPLQISNFIDTIPSTVHIILICGFELDKPEKPWPSVKEPLDSVVELCARSQHRWTIAAPAFLSAWRGGTKAILGNMFDPILLQKNVGSVMSRKGRGEEDIAKRLGMMECVDVRELETEDWVPVMGSKDSLDWLGRSFY